MGRGINKVILVGNLGADPETRYTPGGSAVAELRLATSESWKDKNTGQMQERVEWHTVALFGRLAEVAGEYLRKGRQIYIEGSLRTDKYTDRDGIERYRTKIVGEEMQMLGTAPASDERPAGQGARSAPRSRQPAQSGERDYREARAGSRAAQQALTGEDDEIPF